MTLNKLTVLFFLAGCVSLSPGSEKRIVRVQLKNAQQLNLLQNSFDLAAQPAADVIDLVVDDRQEARLRALGFQPYSLPPEWPELRKRADGADDMGLYHTYAEMIDELKQVVQQYPHIAQLQVIGHSVEDREIYAIKISDYPHLEEIYEPAVLYVGNIHAREIITPEIILYFLQHLVQRYGTDERITRIVNERQLWLVPTLNPDGHVHVETVDVWWRKNRRLNADSSYGVDLNRNFSYHWGVDNIGSSPIPYDDTYRGPQAFSEPESQTIRDLVRTRHFIAAIFYHSYGRSWLFPWSSEYRQTPHHDVFLEMSRHMTQGNDYVIGNVGTGAIYVVNGDTDDYLYGDRVEKNLIFPFSPEVGNTFRQREASILRLVDENLPANVYLAEIANLLEEDPARIFAPGAPLAHVSAVDDDGHCTLSWQPTADSVNQARFFKIQQLTGFATRNDNAEQSSAVLQYDNFSVTQTRCWNGLASYYSATQHPIRSNLSWRFPITVETGQVFSFKAWYELESGFDYFYVQASADQGKTYVNLAGSHTRSDNPYGRNIGNGVTGSSDGWQTLSFDLHAFTGQQTLLRIRHYTEGLDPHAGLYIDDICPMYLPDQERTWNTAVGETAVQVQLQRPGRYGFRIAGIDNDEQQGDWSPLQMVAVDFGRLADVNRDARIDEQDLVRSLELALHDGAIGTCGERWRADMIPAGDSAGVLVDLLDVTALCGRLFSAPPDSGSIDAPILVSMGDVKAQPGERITAPVYLNTRQPLAGLQWDIGNRFNNLVLDSIGTTDGFADFKFLHYQNRVLITSLQNHTLPVGEYKLCDLVISMPTASVTAVDTLFFKEPVIAAARNGRRADSVSWQSGQVLYTATESISADRQAPRSYHLEQNYPNPFNQRTVFRFSLPASGLVTFRLYDTAGREIKTLLQGFYTSGSHAWSWQADHLATGVYLIRMQVNDHSSIRKIVLLK